MIYLTNTTIENGCLRVIPGSHRTNHPLHSLPAAHTKSIATDIDESSPIYSPHPDQHVISVNKGDVVIGDSRLLHSAYANKSKNERPLLTLWYIPNWNQLPPNVHATLSSIYHRKVVDIDDANEDLPTCETWPSYSYEKVRKLLPFYDGRARPLPWNRLPDVSKMLSS